MTDKTPRSTPSLTGTLLQNANPQGRDDCFAYGFVRLAGLSYRIKMYESGYARGEATKKRWRLSFTLVEPSEGKE